MECIPSTGVGEEKTCLKVRVDWEGGVCCVVVVVVCGGVV